MTTFIKEPRMQMKRQDLTCFKYRSMQGWVFFWNKMGLFPKWYWNCNLPKWFQCSHRHQCS